MVGPGYTPPTYIYRSFRAVANEACHGTFAGWEGLGRQVVCGVEGKVRYHCWIVMKMVRAEEVVVAD
jgi:hypothetical protein